MLANVGSWAIVKAVLRAPPQLRLVRIAAGWRSVWRLWGLHTSPGTVANCQPNQTELPHTGVPRMASSGDCEHCSSAQHATQPRLERHEQPDLCPVPWA